MPKRKREVTQEDGAEDGEDRSLKIRKSRLAAKVEQGNTVLHRALKVARGFERQKLGRRQKAANEKPQELLRLREEVIVLKQLDLAKTAENYLLKQLVRTKRIREQPALVSLHGKDAESKVKGPSSGAEANVVARLVNSNPVREVMPEIMGGFYRCLGLEEHPSTPAAKREMESQSAKISSREGGIECEEENQHDTSNQKAEITGDPLKKSNEELADDYDEGSNPEVSDSDEDMAQFDDRLASSSDSEDSNMNMEEDDAPLTQLAHPNSSSRPTQSISPPLPVSLTPSPSPPPSSPLPLKLKALPQAKSHPTNTTFLPSLTLGGYFSGSDSNSDAESDIDHTHNHNHPSSALSQPRKNRRGQRARQQIAEKKYGAKARHLLKQQQQGRTGEGKEGRKGRDEGWDIKRGATDEHARARKGGGRFGKGGAGGPMNRDRTKEAEAGMVRSKAKDNGDGGPIHPSWEAARKRKLQGQKAASAGAFQGKKISYD